MHHDFRGRDWVNEFSDVDFGDQRLTKRLVGLSLALSQNFSTSLSQVNKDWASQKASYRFFENQRVEEEEIIHAHREATLQRAQNHKRLIAIQDSTTFNFHKYKHLITDLGLIGQGRNAIYGLQMHATLLVSGQGEALGLLDWDLWAPSVKSGSKLRNNRPVCRWFDHLENIGEAGEELKKEIIMVADREADITGLLVGAKRRGVHVVLRAKNNRRISSPCPDKLLYYLQRQPEQFRYHINVEKRHELLGNTTKKKRTIHQRREVELKVHYATVELNPAHKKHGIGNATDEELTCSAVLVEEVHPSNKENSIQWVLISTLPVQNNDEARDIIEIYRKRWQIEEYFKTLKSGCQAEAVRLSSARKLSRYICLKSIIATEVYQLKEASRKRPQDSCDEILTSSQWKMLVLIIQQLDGKRLKVPKHPPSMQQAANWIGRIGGHLGRKRDGPPGVTTLWRGYQELLHKAEGFQLLSNVL
jgi:hypothetical protein